MAVPHSNIDTAAAHCQDLILGNGRSTIPVPSFTAMI